MVEKFDAVVVGAGPAGVAASLTMARGGLKVLQLERGDFAGSKNMFGGLVFTQPIEDLVGPEFWVTLPGKPPQVERYIAEYQYWFLSPGAHTAFTHRNNRFRERYNAFSALRARFDPWLARKAEEAGVMLVTKTTALEVIKNGNRIMGVKSDRGDVHANVVIAADGANSLLAKQAGLHGEIPPQDVALGVKETLFLPREKIEERFNLKSDEGVAIVFINPQLPGVGAGFLYTNKDTISLGFGTVLRDLAEGRSYRDYRGFPNQLMEAIKNHPSISPLLEGGVTREYTAHLIPEGGFKALPPLYTDGMMVVGDAAMLVNALNFEGTNLAITSGKLAGQAAVEAAKKGDFSRAALSRYEEYLRKSYVLKDLKKFRNVPAFFRGNKHFFQRYPPLLNDVMYLWHEVDGRSKEEHIRQMKRLVYRSRSRLGILRDLWGIWRNTL